MTYTDALRHHVERSLRGDLDIRRPEPDGDGDYGPHAVGTAPVWVRSLFEHDPPLVRVWAAAARSVKKSAALLKELNELNIGLQQIRCLYVNRTVVVSCEAEIESIEPGQLGRLVNRVGTTSEHVGQLIAAMYGGERVTLVDSDTLPVSRE